MSSIVQSGWRADAYGLPAEVRRAGRTRGGGFLELAASVRRGAAALGDGGAEASSAEAYRKHLERKYGRVTVASVGKDAESLAKAGRRMSGRDVVVAPNLLADMAQDAQKAACYERKIDGFFQSETRLKAHFAAQGLTYETCGVVLHEDGSITYICGGGDSPERVAEVNRINREKRAGKAAQDRVMQARALQAETLGKAPSGGGPREDRMAFCAADAQSFLPEGTELFYFGF